MHCVNCGSQVSPGGSFCRDCGVKVISVAEGGTDPITPSIAEKRKTRMGFRKIFLIATAAIITLSVISSFLPDAANTANDGESSQSQSSATSSNNAPQKPIAVTASELFKAYEANEASAQNYFGKHQLLVSGTVEKVALDMFENPEILLRTTNQFLSAHAALAEGSKSGAGNYNPGDKVLLLCEGVSEVASIPMLKDCRQAPDGLIGDPVKWSK